MAHGSFPIEGEVVDEATVAKALGFVDVDALRWYHDHREWNKDNMTEFLLQEVANLRSRIAEMAK